MTREQTKTCLETAVRSCYYGATKYSRLVWCLRQAGIGLRDARLFIREAFLARLLETRVSKFDPWVSATPFLVGIAANFDELAADVEAWQGGDR